MPKVQSLPSALRGRRLELGLTQAAVAARIGVTTSTICLWETGTKPIPRARATQIADAVGLTDGWARPVDNPLPDLDGIDPIVKALHKRRQVLELTREELGGRLYVVGKTIQNWEAGRHDPSLTMLRRWACELGVRIEAVIAEHLNETTGGGK